MAIAAQSTIGLSNWPETASNVLRLPSGPRELAWLAQTPLWVEQEAWRGRPVVDVRGRRVGRVRDVLVETRTLDQAADEDGPRGWGVRAAYVAVSCRGPWRFWSRPHEVLLPAAKMWQADGLVHAGVDAVELWPRMFGHTI